MKPVEFKCKKCGLCQDDHERECKISGEEIILFDGEDDDEIVDGIIHRSYAFCGELNDVITVDSDPNHSLDFLRSAVECYARQIGLDEDKVSHHVLLMRGSFQDAIAYDYQVIGVWFGECVKNLDKAADGESFGRSLDEWRD